MNINIDTFHHYDDNDYEITSARPVVEYIVKILKNKPSSVIDIGCGLAQWLLAFKEHGINEVLGVDGSHVPLERLNIEKSEFKPHDLRELTFESIGKRFDLLLCLEVVEHLEEKYAYKFVQTLTQLSDVIIFSAAVPYQTGENHFNEQYPDYWEAIFKEFDYSFLDPFREKFWQNENIPWWYSQNMFLVVKSDLKQNYHFPYNGNIYIHPKLLELQASINQNFYGVPSKKQKIKNIIKSILKKSTFL